MGGATALLAFLGGTWFPITGDGGFAHDSPSCLPSYWLVQASHVGIGGDAWGATGWVVVGAWSARAGRARRARLPARHRAGVSEVERAGHHAATA